MDRAQTLVAEARLNNNRTLHEERAAELAAELDTLLEASQTLGERLGFDDQASDYAQALMDTAAPTLR